MKNYKVECDIQDYNQSNSKREFRIIYVTANSENEAESMAKYHFLITKQGFAFYGVGRITVV